MKVRSLFSDLPEAGPEEEFATILDRPGVRIERIVSHGHATPVDTPFDQAEDEWVLLVRGAARLWIEGIGDREFLPGDHLTIPARTRHRVTWTIPDEPTIWLAVHLAPLPEPG